MEKNELFQYIFFNLRQTRKKTNQLDFINKSYHTGCTRKRFLLGFDLISANGC